MTKETSESCVSHNTQKLTSTLFTWTASPTYADSYMNTFYNSILALQSGHSGKCVYHLPLGSPRKKEFLKENDFRCCNGSTIEAFASLNSCIYYHNDSALWVNLYLPSRVNWAEKNVVLEQAGDFPVDTCVEFTISTKKSSTFVLKLLIPSRVQNAEVYVNNVKQNNTIVPDSYVILKRQWKNNDKIKLVFHYDFNIQTMPDDKNVFAIFYGPTLLAFLNESELILKGNHDVILKNLSKDKNSNTFHLNNNGKTYQLKPFYEIEEQSYGVYATVRNY
jgi:hypothetical protein